MTIRSASEFLDLLELDSAEARHRRHYETATEDVWLELVERHPNAHESIVLNKTVPGSILLRLIPFLDPRLRSLVASTYRIPKEAFELLARDSDELVRSSVAQNFKTPRHVLEALARDPSDWVAERARERLDRAHLGGHLLEQAVGEFFNSSGAGAREGPQGAWDLEVTFPQEFRERRTTGETVPFKVNATLIVEAKASAGKGASREMCRQLSDWVEEAWRRSEADPARPVDAWRRALADAEERLTEDNKRQVLKRLHDAAEGAIRALTLRPKGLLVMNHKIRMPEEERAEGAFPHDVVQWATRHEIVLASWPDLLRVERDIASGTLSPFNFWCYLLSTSGPIKLPITYRWEHHCTDYGTMVFHGDGKGVFPRKRPPFLQEPD